MPTACFTGHRKINGQFYNRLNPTPEWQTLRTYLDAVNLQLVQEANVDHFISGLAIGVDMLAAESVLHVRGLITDRVVRLTGAVPFPSQANRWPEPSRQQWAEICGMCNAVVNVSQDPYSPAKMQVRNEWMVDRSDYVIAVWNGMKSGGTWNCITYAHSLGRPVLYVQYVGGVNWSANWVIK